VGNEGPAFCIGGAPLKRPDQTRIGRPGTCVAVIVGLVGLLCPAVAGAIPGSGPHETVDITGTTTRPNTSTGLNWYATYRNPTNPHADPPALRRIVIIGPRGTRSDTSVTAQCGASDSELMQKGEAACPPRSRIGWGKATPRILGVASNTFDTTLFNADSAQIELVKFMGGGAGVVRAKIHRRRLDGPVPTCLMGGQPPKDCPFDEVVLLSNELHQRAVSVGRGRHRRNLLTTPRSCPRSRKWRTRVRFYYADGSVDRVVTRQPCSPRR
jgi:hypothetical protein